MASPRILPPLEQGVSDLVSIIARLQAGPRIMDSLPAEPPVRPGFGLQGAQVQPSDLLDKLRQPENWKFGSMPQRPTTGDAPEYVYHGTNTERAYEIAADGKLRTFKPNYGTDQSVWPDGSTAKRAYFSGNQKTVESFFPEGKPAVLRVRKGAGFKRESGTGDIYSEKPIPASGIEILAPDGSWIPLSEWAK